MAEKQTGSGESPKKPKKSSESAGIPFSLHSQLIRIMHDLTNLIDATEKELQTRSRCGKTEGNSGYSLEDLQRLYVMSLDTRRRIRERLNSDIDQNLITLRMPR